MTITTNASASGWGAVFGCEKTNGRWSVEERELHINILEMKVLLFGLMTFRRELEGIQMKCEMDNMRALAYINHQGGTKSVG